MQRIPVILAGVVLSASAAMAQVTTDPSALDALRKPQSQPRAHPASRRPPPQTPPPASGPAQTQAAPAPTPQQPAQPTPSAPVASQKPPVPATPPAILALPPPVQVPIAPTAPIADVPVVDAAAGAVRSIKGGVRVTFGPDSADFNSATIAALQAFAQAQASDVATPINIYAYATGNPDDPSTPRRLSLRRALAARAVLLRAGIASPRIYPRALGPTSGDDPDRIDVVAGPAVAPGTGTAPGVAPDAGAG